MANTGFVIAADSTGPTLSSARFTPAFGNRDNDSTESFSQVIVRSAGTYHDLFMRETGTGNGVLTYRKTSANGNQTVTGAGAGTYHDSTHTDAVTGGEKLNYGATTASLTASLIAMLFDSTTNFAVREATVSNGGVSYTSGNNFTSMNGSYNGAGSESKAKARNQKTCVMSNGMANVSANNKTQAVTVQSRKNGSNGNIAVSVTASTAAIFEDTTHTDSLSAGDDWNYSLVNGTDTTHTQTYRSMAVDYTTSTGSIFIVQASVGADIAGTASTATFCPIGGQFELGTTESATQTNALGTFTYSNVTALQSVASTNTGTYNFRKNTGNGNQTFTFGTSAANYTDSTHTDAVISTDAINHSFTCGASTPGSFTMVQSFGNAFPGYNQTVYIEWEES